MYTRAALLDVHARTHRSLAAVLDLVGTFPAEDLVKPVEGFSYPTIVTQLHHLLGAERYWVNVLQGRIRLDDDAESHQSVAAMRRLKDDVARATIRFLESCSDEEVSTPRTVKQWNGKEVSVMPARVVLRTQTHVYQHHGEISAMTRLLGHRFKPGLDFPLA